MKDETYNGWTNRSTWCTYSWLTNEEWSYEKLMQIVNRRGSVEMKALRLESYVRKTFYPSNGLFRSDLYPKRLGGINWKEIVESVLEV